MGVFLHPRAVHVLLRIQQASCFSLCYLGFVVCILHYKRRKQCSPADTVKYLLLNDLWCVDLCSKYIKSATRNSSFEVVHEYLQVRSTFLFHIGFTSVCGNCKTRPSQFWRTTQQDTSTLQTHCAWKRPRSCSIVGHIDEPKYF